MTRKRCKKLLMALASSPDFPEQTRNKNLLLLRDFKLTPDSGLSYLKIWESNLGKFIYAADGIGVKRR